ncbi:MAG: hypothetical protein KF778_10840 [Rhodocyclaceae bacterium]|nr:hypothetical protein [Rhodocyclaceae bacterium]MBX3668889.1 hypothetical protein [Rhodocyclaceae bacterium]
MSQNINLFDVSLRPRRDLLRARPLACVWLITAALMGAGAWAAQAQRAGRQDELQAARQEVERERKRFAAAGAAIRGLRPDAELLAELQQLEQAEISLGEVARTLKGGLPGTGSGFAPALRALAASRQEGIWLTHVELAVGGAEISLAGRALDSAALPAWIARLSAQPQFHGHSFGDLSLRRNMQPAALSAPGAMAGAAPAGAETAPFVEFRLAAHPAQVVGGARP